MHALTVVSSFVIFSLIFISEIQAEGEIVGRCTVPEPPLFGSISINYKKNKIIYSCDEGFNRAGGSRSRTCKKLTYGGGSYYDWTGRSPTCYSKERFIRECPSLEDPQNGYVIVSSYKPGGRAEYFCDQGYLVLGSQTIRCRDDLEWSDGFPTCEARNSVKDFANALKDKFVDKYAPSSGPSEGKLQAGKSGLDLIFAVDVSASIGPESLKNAKKFVKVIVEKFGINNDSLALTGTRIAVVTFSDTAKFDFNLDDANVRSIEEVNKKVNKIKLSGGGTDFINLLRTLSRNHLNYFGKFAIRKNPKIKDRKENANRAIFIITDAEETSTDVGGARASVKFRRLANTLKEDDGYEIFAIGIGTQIQKSLLTEIASPPHLEHVFLIKDRKDLKKIGETIAEENIDYGKCGISGNTVAGKGGVSKEAGWPWIGWYSVVRNSGSMITCGGVLLCDEWFMTLASCVTEINGDIIVTLEDRINLYLADKDIFTRDDNELMVPISEVHVHPNYTGDANEYGIRPFDIALLRLGQDNSTRPTLNKYIKPICFLEMRDPTSYNQGKTLLSFLKSENKRGGVVAGWGHMGKQQVSSKKMFPWAEMKQFDSDTLPDKICLTKYRSLDPEMFFCVGNIHQAPSEHCPGDIGGPLMKELEIHRIAVLGLAVKTSGCVSGDTYNFNIFLNIFHPEINKWVQSVLRGCNRLNDFIPYIEEEAQPASKDGDENDEEDGKNDVDPNGEDHEVNGGDEHVNGDEEDVNEEENETNDGDDVLHDEIEHINDDEGDDLEDQDDDDADIGDDNGEMEDFE